MRAIFTVLQKAPSTTPPATAKPVEKKKTAAPKKQKAFATTASKLKNEN